MPAINWVEPRNECIAWPTQANLQWSCARHWKIRRVRPAGDADPGAGAAGVYRDALSLIRAAAAKVRAVHKRTNAGSVEIKAGYECIASAVIRIIVIVNWREQR